MALAAGSRALQKSLKPICFSMYVASRASLDPNIAPRGFKMAPSDHPDGTKWPQSDPELPKTCPKGAQDCV